MQRGGWGTLSRRLAGALSNWPMCEPQNGFKRTVPRQKAADTRGPGRGRTPPGPAKRLLPTDCWALQGGHWGCDRTTWPSEPTMAVRSSREGVVVVTTPSPCARSSSAGRRSRRSRRCTACAARTRGQEPWVLQFEILDQLNVRFRLCGLRNRLIGLGDAEYFAFVIESLTDFASVRAAYARSRRQSCG